MKYMNLNKPYSLKQFTLTVTIPIVAFWTALFLLGYPIPSIDDLFFTGAAINLAKGGEFTNPYLEAWNAAFSSGKFYFQPPFHSYTLAAWLKIAGISTNSLRLFQYFCYNIFSLSCALILRHYSFPRITALFATVFFAAWHCNPNFLYSPGFRQDALAMAYLALGLWLLTADKCWRYFFGFAFIESAVLTSPVTAAYTFPFGLAIPVINYIYSREAKENKSKYFFTVGIALLGATGLIFLLFLLCVNFDLRAFTIDFLHHASFRKNSPLFVIMTTQGFGPILFLPTYFLFLTLATGVLIKRYLITLDKKVLFIALISGIIFNFLLYSAALWFSLFFCWLGIVAIISLMRWKSKIQIYAFLVAIIIYLTSQSINIIALIGRANVAESKYQKIRELVIANPEKKYAVDSVAARFVFDYKLPKNSIDWNFMMPPPAAGPTFMKDKPYNTTGIVSKFLVGNFMIDANVDYPRVEIFNRKFKSLPKKPFDLIVIP